MDLPVRLITACSGIINSGDINFDVTPQTTYLSSLNIGMIAHGAYIINDEEKIKLKRWLIHSDFNWFASMHHRKQSKNDRVLMAADLFLAGQLITTEVLNNYQKVNNEPDVGSGSMSSSDLMRHLMK